MNEVVGKRATNAAQKNARRIIVLEAASALFVEAGFFDVSMSMIAKKAGVAKGTIYIYFSSKEEIFLALCTKELDAWLLQLDEELKKVSGTLDNSEFTELLRGSFENKDTMCRLISLMHLVLEKNVSYDEVLAFKRHLLGLTLRICERVETVLPFLEKGQGISLMTSFHCLVVGWSQMTETSPVLEKVLENPDMAPFNFGLEDSLFGSFRMLLDGAKFANVSLRS